MHLAGGQYRLSDAKSIAGQRLAHQAELRLTSANGSIFTNEAAKGVAPQQLAVDGKAAVPVRHGSLIRISSRCFLPSLPFSQISLSEAILQADFVWLERIDDAIAAALEGTVRTVAAD